MRYKRPFVRIARLGSLKVLPGWELTSPALKNRPLQAVIGSGWVGPHSCAPAQRSRSHAHTLALPARRTEPRRACTRTVTSDHRHSAGLPRFEELLAILDSFINNTSGRVTASGARRSPPYKYELDSHEAAVSVVTHTMPAYFEKYYKSFALIVLAENCDVSVNDGTIPRARFTIGAYVMGSAHPHVSKIKVNTVDGIIRSFGMARWRRCVGSSLNGRVVAHAPRRLRATRPTMCLLASHIAGMYSRCPLATTLDILCILNFTLLATTADIL